MDLAANGFIVAGKVVSKGTDDVVPLNTFILVAGALAHPACLDESHFEKLNSTSSNNIDVSSSPTST